MRGVSRPPSQSCRISGLGSLLKANPKKSPQLSTRFLRICAWPNPNTPSINTSASGRVEHRGKPSLSDYACLRAYLAVRIDAGSDFLFTGQKGPLHRWALNRMFVDLRSQVSDVRVARGLKPIPQGCFRFHTLKHSVATTIANRVQNIFTLKNHLGHATILSSMSYAHPDPRSTAVQVQHALSVAFSGF